MRTRSKAFAPLLLSLALLLSALPRATPALAAPFPVNATVDGHDANPGNGLCETSVPGQCTLRAAIEEVNALPGSGPHRIDLPAGTYTVNLGGGGGPQLLVNANVDIVGAGQATTIVDGAGFGAALMWTCGSGCTATPKTVTLSNLTLRNSGDAGFLHASGAGPTTLTNVTVTQVAGGGIHNQAPSNLTLTNVTITTNTVPGTNAVGGLSNGGTLTATNLTVSNNVADGSGRAGGIYNEGSLTITGGTVSGNSTTGGCAGGIMATGGQLTLSNVTVSGNVGANQSGGCAAGGLWLGGGDATLTNVDVLNNSLTGAQVAASYLLNKSG